MPLEIQLSKGEGCDPSFKLNPATVCACPNLGPGSPTLYIVVLFICSLRRDERRLFVVLILVESMSITVLIYPK